MQENGKRKGSAMNIEIAQRLYELRRKHGYSQESLAAALGLSRQAISKWERSESAPDMGNLIALADLYGMTIDELIRPAVEGGEGFEGFGDDENGESEAGESAPLNCENDESKAVSETIEVVEEEAGPQAQGAEPQPAAQQPQQESDSVQQNSAQQDAAQQENVKQVSAHGHIYTKPAGDGRPRCALRRFPYPLLITVLVLVLVLIFGLWEYIWLFLTIPFYYWIARVIERDPIFLERNGYVTATSAASNGSKTAYDAAYAVNAGTGASGEVR